jgi:hypothetical protein
MRISSRLPEYRHQARENLTAEDRQRLQAACSTDVETVFGIMKHYRGFRKFHLRGQEKVKTEWGLVSIAHKMKTSFLSFFHFYRTVWSVLPDSPLTSKMKFSIDAQCWIDPVLLSES